MNMISEIAEKQDPIIRVAEFVDAGKYLTAYKIVRECQPFSPWKGGYSRAIAGRLAAHLGNARLGLTLIARAWRAQPQHLEVAYCYGQALLSGCGPFAAWEFTSEGASWPDATPYQRSLWLSLRAQILSAFRDFDRANTNLKQAETLSPRDPWLWVVRAGVRIKEDRYAEALEAARQALELRPGYPPAVLAVARSLTLVERAEEALDFLADAARTTESNRVIAELAATQDKFELFDGVERSLERYGELAPLLCRAGKQWLAAWKMSVAYRAGDRQRAIGLAAPLVESPEYGKFARCLQASRGGKRVILPVGFIRQHHMTCGPATLVTLSHYWSKPAEHLEVATEICYGGTFSHSERRWAEEQGWFVREFAVTWEAAVAAIDRGIPFALATVFPTHAHLQAVIGYDSCLQKLLVRDPYDPSLVEFWADTFFEQQRASGPRGLAMVPQAEKERLETLELPDTELYDWLYDVNRALQQHDRDFAAATLALMQKTSPHCRLTLEAARALAIYDGDRVSLLALTEKLLKLFPDDEVLLAHKLACLEDLARMSERENLLEELCTRPQCHPIFWQKYARLIRDDGREADKLEVLLKKLLQAMPETAETYAMLGGFYWQQQQLARGAELYRFASCLEDKNQNYAARYFVAARHLQETDRVLRMLEARAQRDRQQSSEPAMLVAWAYEQLDRPQDALQYLLAAQTNRPDDGSLLLYRARLHSRYGQIDVASELLERAHGLAARRSWLRVAASLTELRGDLNGALSLWQEIVAADPLAEDANQAVSRLLSETIGPRAAVEFLATACQQFPYSYFLHQLWYERSETQAEENRILQHLLEIHPNDPWTRRQWAMQLAQQQRFADAFAALELARDLEPNSIEYYGAYSYLCIQTRQREAANAALRQALRLQVDSEWAMSQLLDLCQSQAEYCEVLDLIYQEMCAQRISGDGLLSYQSLAAGMLAPETLLARLQEGQHQRPDLWQSWAALIRQLVDMNRLPAALEFASAATQRFPLLARLWLELADVHYARQDEAATIDALEKALAVSPGWGDAIRRLVRIYESRPDLDRCRELLETAIALEPQEVTNHAYLASILWQVEAREAAIERLEMVLAIEPGYNWAWEKLQDWGTEVGRPQLAAEQARHLVRQRGGEARSWLLLAENLDSDPAILDERLQALGRAIALNPLLESAYDLQAQLLAENGRIDEAIAACEAPVWGTDIPAKLQARAAWVESVGGNPEAALQRSYALTERYPDYSVGWRLVAAWLQRTDDPTGTAKTYLNAAEQLVRLTPDEATSWGYLGHARLRLEDDPGAKVALTKALELNPGYRYAGTTLADLEMAAGNCTATAEILSALEGHLGDDAEVLSRQTILAARQGNLNAVVEPFQRLCYLQVEDDEPLGNAAQAIKDVWGFDVIERLLLANLKHPSRVNPSVGRIWAKCVVKLKRWQERQPALKHLLECGRVGIEAHDIYAWQLYQHGEVQCYLEFVSDAGAALRRHVRSWTLAGSILERFHRYAAAIDWLSAHPYYGDCLEPRMLSDLAESYLALNRFQDSRRICRLAMELPGGRSSPYFIVRSTYFALLSAPSVTVEAGKFNEIDTNDLNEYNQALYYFVKAMLEVSSDRGSMASRFARARETIALGRQANSYFYREPVLIKTFFTAVDFIAASGPPALTHAWASTQNRYDRFYRFIQAWEQFFAKFPRRKPVTNNYFESYRKQLVPAVAIYAGLNLLATFLLHQAWSSPEQTGPAANWMLALWLNAWGASQVGTVQSRSRNADTVATWIFGILMVVVKLALPGGSGDRWVLGAMMFGGLGGVVAVYYWAFCLHFAGFSRHVEGRCALVMMAFTGVTAGIAASEGQWPAVGTLLWGAAITGLGFWPARAMVVGYRWSVISTGLALAAASAGGTFLLLLLLLPQAA